MGRMLPGNAGTRGPGPARTARGVVLHKTNKKVSMRPGPPTMVPRSFSATRSSAKDLPPGGGLRHVALLRARSCLRNRFPQCFASFPMLLMQPAQMPRNPHDTTLKNTGAAEGTGIPARAIAGTGCRHLRFGGRTVSGFRK